MVSKKFHDDDNNDNGVNRLGENSQGEENINFSFNIKFIISYSLFIMDSNNNNNKIIEN